MLSRSLRRWLIVAAVVALLIVAYTVFGFVGVPRLLRSNLESFVSTHYSRRVSIGEIHFNPYTLALEIRTLSMPDADGQPMLGFSRLFVNVGIVSLWRRGPSFQQIALENPFARVLIRPDGSLNLADLSKGFPPHESKPKEPSQPMRLFIDRLSVRAGRTLYEDRSRRDPFVADLQPITFDLRDFSTTGKTGNLYALEGASEAGERFKWNGTLGVNPVASRGHFEVDRLLARTLWTYIRDSVAFQIASGTIALAGDYDFTTAGTPVGLTLDVHDVTVTDLGITPKGQDSHYVDLARIEVHDTKVDLAKRSVQIAKIRLAGGGIHAWRGQRGAINLLELAPATASATPAPGAQPAAAPAPSGTATAITPAATPAVATPATPPPGQPGWTVAAPDIALEAFKVSAEDRQVAPTMALTLDPLNVHITGFTTAPGASLEIELDSGINRGGRIGAKAKVSPDSASVTARAELTGLDLTAFQPYIAQQTSMTLLGGVLGTTLNIERGADGALAVTGDAKVTKLRTIDNELQKDFIKWDDLRVAGIDFRSKPTKLHIGSIDTRGLYARVIISAQSELNVTEVLTPASARPTAAQPVAAGQPVAAAQLTAATQDSAEAKPAAKSARSAKSAGVAKPAARQARAAAPEASASGAIPVSIGTVRIVDGSAHFADYSIQPNYAVAIQSLNGSIAGLSSDSKSRAKLKLEGKVDRYAPVNIEGEINLLSATAFSDVRMSFKGVELSSVTPYSGRFAGYKIEKGKLSADLSYHIEQRKLKADHHIVIDQLQLGDKVESPEATKLPLKLAIALLKDRNGVIDLGLPVTGSLDDPQFRIGPLIWKVVVNLLTKAATAPFALLGRLFGGGEEMNLVDFKPGTAALDPAEQQKLAALVKAMKERPQLELDVPMAFSPELDRPVLARQALQARLIALKQKELAGHKNAAPADETVLADPAEHFRLLAAEYRVELGKDAPLPDSALAVEAAKKKKGDTPPFDPAIADLESPLLMHTQIEDGSLEELGKHRAHSIQAALLGGGEIDAARIFLIDAPPKKNDSKDVVRVEMALK